MSERSSWVGTAADFLQMSVKHGFAKRQRRWAAKESARPGRALAASKAIAISLLAIKKTWRRVPADRVKEDIRVKNRGAAILYRL
jgi:hypothetical protein